MSENKLKIICSLGTLLSLAKEMARLRKLGDNDAYLKAKQEHDNYQKLCLEADQLMW